VATLRISQSPLRQIALKSATTGFIYAGSANGLLSAVNTNCDGIPWVKIYFLHVCGFDLLQSVLTETSGQGSRMFCLSSSTDMILPESGMIRFADAFTGELLHYSLQDCLHEPSSILLNEFNNVRLPYFVSLFSLLVGFNCIRLSLSWSTVQV
jgi:hypothetical protein